jgi:hypothetical protein
MFELKDIECTYDGNNTVLSIPELNLSSGKLYFFIGASGVGRQTCTSNGGRPIKLFHLSGKNTSHLFSKIPILCLISPQEKTCVIHCSWKV